MTHHGLLPMFRRYPRTIVYVISWAVIILALAIADGHILTGR